MPLEAGRSREAFSNNVREMLAAGHPRAQAIAAAYQKAGEDCAAQDMSPADWQGLLSGLLEFFSEEAEEPEHKTQAADIARDADVFALDGAEENRTKTPDGRLLVKNSIFSAAMVCPYLGKEIPDYQALGLDPTKVYYLYRDPVELKKAAPTFDKIPVLLRHEPSTAEDHPSDITVGTTGEKTKFTDPNLEGSLAIWDQAGIDAIESGKQKAISLGYRYKPVMTPGKTADGVPWDGKMVDIVGNHLALVSEPRVPFAAVGDSAEGLNRMKVTTGKLSPMGSAARGVIVAALHPMFAADAALDLKPVLGAVRQKSWAADKARILTALPALIKGKGPKLATDAEVGPIVKQVEKLLDTINPAEEGMDDDPDMAGMDEAETEEEKAERMKRRQEAKDRAMDEEETEEEKERRLKMRKDAKDKAARDAAAEADPKPAGPAMKPGGEDEKEEPVSKAAMDAAIKDTAERTRAATIREMNAIADAREHVGKIAGRITIACDSADAVYAAALKTLGISATGLNLAGMKLVVDREIAHKGEKAKPAFQGANDSARLTERQAAEERLGIKTKRAVRV